MNSVVVHYLVVVLKEEGAHVDAAIDACGLEFVGGREDFSLCEGKLLLDYRWQKSFHGKALVNNL